MLVGWSFWRPRISEKAKVDFEQAIALGPNDPSYHNNLGIALGRLGYHEKALESFDQAISLDDQISAPYLGKGEALTSWIAIWKH
ncbi:MAG: tetratricopeptide repeat protein [Candidatus Promineifilaceae bacterium]